MDSSTSARSIQLPKPRIYSEEEWNAQKIKFTELYESNTLKHTMEIMKRDHGFFATERQYERRIGKWRLDKNVKGVEMLLIIRKKVERKLVNGKNSSFCVRNRKVRSDKISRYEKRKNVLASELLRLTEGVASDTPMCITCHTPQPKENSISHSPSPMQQQISNEYGIADGPMPIDIGHDPGIPHGSTLMLRQWNQVVSAALIETRQNEVPVVVAPTPSRSIIHSDTVALALHDINASVPASPIWHSFWEEASSNLAITTSINSLIGETGPEIPLSGSPSLLSNNLIPSAPCSSRLESSSLHPSANSGFIVGLDSLVQELLNTSSEPASVHPIPEDDTAIVDTNECLSNEEKQYDQQLTTLGDELGHAHPQVLAVTLQLSSMLMLQRRYKYVSKGLWQLAEARRSIVKSIDETTIEVVDTLVPMFCTEVETSKANQFLTLLIDCFSKAQPINSAIYGRVQCLRAEISEIDRLRKVAIEHKQFIKFERIGITGRGDIRSLNSICLAIDDLVNSAIAAALITRGFRLEARDVKDKTDINGGGGLDVSEKFTSRFSFFTTRNLEFSLMVIRDFEIGNQQKV